MDWIESINQWRQLSAREQLRRRWEAIPEDVAQSMAFEGEPVDIRFLQELLAEIEPPDLLKQPEGFNDFNNLTRSE